MYRYVVPWLGKDTPPWQERAYYLMAALFAIHPQAGGSGNLGTSFAQARSKLEDETAIERRFTALLAAHTDDLDFYLRQAISFLRSKEIPVNWHQLLFDLMQWGHPEYGDKVRKNWANSFWGATQNKKQMIDDSNKS
jgi:CRISPR system Cascade subunit CasB